MGMRERNRFGRMAAHLEREALKLGEDVRRLMKSGKEMSAQELKDLRKLLRKTAKTAKSASHHNHPESPPALPPPPPLPAPPLPPPGSQQGEQPPPPEPPHGQDLSQVLLPLPPPGPKPRGDHSRGSPSDSSSTLSSSDSDNSSGDGTLESLLRHRRQARMSKRKGFLVVENLGDVQWSQKKKKLQILKPDVYDGSIDTNPTYQRWYKTINDYLNHNRGTWDGHTDLIRVIGAYLKGKARDWYDNWARQLRANRKIDSWPAFVSAMDERFKTSHEADATFVEMATVVSREVLCPILISWLTSMKRQTFPVPPGETCSSRASRMSSERI